MIKYVHGDLVLSSKLWTQKAVSEKYAYMILIQRKILSACKMYVRGVVIK